VVHRVRFGVDADNRLAFKHFAGIGEGGLVFYHQKLGVVCHEGSTNSSTLGAPNGGSVGYPVYAEATFWGEKRCCFWVLVESL
jgi:hypothetical protein